MPQIKLDNNGNTLAYAEYGNRAGFPILIQHGLIASIRDGWLFERLVQMGARLICIARPGYGESSPCEMDTIAGWAELVSALIDELNLAQFDVLGMSSGAPYSYALGWRFPEKARNLYIFSGIPALYDDEVLSHWPYPVNKHASIAELQKLAHELFFSNLSTADIEKDDIRDSMQNDCFGIALDLKLRCVDWGFALSQVNAPVFMRHSRCDPNVPFITAQLTAQRLPHCTLEVKESDIHFSVETLNDFFESAIAPFFQNGSGKTP